MASNAHNDKLTDMEGTAGGATAGANSSTPKQKRLACEICRRRKLKCDGTKPSCSTCSRLGHVCAYDERRKKSGPKKGHLKALAEKLSALFYKPSCPSRGFSYESTFADSSFFARRAS